MAGEKPPLFDRDHVLSAVHDQSRPADAWQQALHVDQHQRLGQSPGHGRTGRRALETSLFPARPWIICLAAGKQLDRRPGPPDSSGHAQLFHGPRRRPVGGRPVKDQAANRFVMGDREPYGDRPALGESEQDRPLHTGLSDHGGQVGIALLEGREFLDRIRQSSAAFVEAHHAGEGRETTDERAAGAVLPLHLQVRREAGNDHYGLPMTEDLVGDVRPAPSGVASNRCSAMPPLTVPPEFPGF